MPPSSRSASSRPSLSSTRSTPPTDDGGSKMASPKKTMFPDMSLGGSIDNEDGDLSTFPEEVALPSETSHDTLLETTSKDDTEIDAIFEQSTSESESPLRPPSIPDYHFSGPRNYSRLTERDSDDERSGTPPPNPFGPSIRSATLNTAGRVAGDNGMVLPSAVSESSSPYVSGSRLSSRGGTLSSVFQDVPIFSPFSSQKKKKSKHGFPRSNPSPSRKGRMLDVPIAPSPDPSPLVLLHVTLLPLPPQGPASSVLANHLRKMISPTVVARGLLLPHPNDDYDALVEMIAENLGLDQETPPPFKKSATYSLDECASHSEGSYLGSSDDDGEAYCPTCTRRRLKPEFCRHERPRKHRRPYTHTEKWYTINIFASNGLMRSGAWSRSWEEMERIDVEVTVTPGYEDIDPPKGLRPSSQRSEGKRSLQGSFQFKRRIQPLAGVETTTDEEMPRPRSRRLSAGRRKTSGTRVPSGSLRSRASSNYIKQEPLSELEIPFPDTDKVKEIYEDGLGAEVPIFEPPTEEEGEFVPIWEDGDDKEDRPTGRSKSEDAWTTDEETARKQVNTEIIKSPSPPAALSAEKEEDRRLSAFTMDTAIHHSIVGSSRGTSVESDAITSSEPEGISTVSPSPSPEQRKTSNPHRLHPSSRRASLEISPAGLSSYAASEKTASRPTSSRAPNAVAIVGLAISDETEVVGDLEDDKENHHESIDNKENIPVDISDEEPEIKAGIRSSGVTDTSQYPSENEKPTVTPLRNRRAVTPKTAGPSPMLSRFSSPDISPDISPIASRAGSPQPQTTKEPSSRERRRRSIRRSFDKSFDTTSFPGSRIHSRQNSSSGSATTPALPTEESPRGRSVSRSVKQTPSSSPSPLEKEITLPDNFIDRLRIMIKPTIDTLAAIPLPTLLLIAIPFAGLIAFSVNSYVQQRNLDYMVRSFMDSQVMREMQILQQQQQVVPNLNPMPLEVQYAPVPPFIVQEVLADAEKAMPPPEPTISVEEKANLEWQEAQNRGLEHESVVYGIQVGGKCVMAEDVPAAIRQAAYEREGLTPPETTTEQPQHSDIDDLLDLEEEEEDLLGPEFATIKSGLDLELEDDGSSDAPIPNVVPRSPKVGGEDVRGRGDQRPQEDDTGYERAGSRSPPLAAHRRDRSMERKNVAQQPYDYYHQPNKPVYDDYDRMSEAGDIDVGKTGIRDGGLDAYNSDIPDLELPPPIREIPASPSKVQVPVVEPSQGPLGPSDAGASKSPYHGAEEPQHTPADSAELEVQGPKPLGPELPSAEELLDQPAGALETQDPSKEQASRPVSRQSASIDSVPEEGEELPEPVVRTGYTPQQRPYDYKSRPSSRNGPVDEPETAPAGDVDTDPQDTPSRPPTRNGRASSRPPPSRSASRSRASSRSSRSRSRPRSSGGSHNAVPSSGTMETVEETEVLVEPAQETATYGPSLPHDAEDSPTDLPQVPVEVLEPETELKDLKSSFFEKFGIPFGPQVLFGPMNKELESPAVTSSPEEEEPSSETTAPVLESVVAEQEVEVVPSIPSPSPSPVLSPSESSSEYDQYEDAEEDYDYDDQYQYQYDPDQYEDYAEDSQDEYQVPDDYVDEEYAYDDEDTEATGEFDYEEFTRSLWERND
ncbi:hypothetical protein TWF730_010446 [Orbilia blumenaviensis]|uniref:Uncharacterized protein n=1 Tax=Orbilia blumenaviensis TaxID=1796055 RepID=A0AAV9UP90_9PEZI